MVQLSKRLSAIADQVKPGSRVADIGSDHGLLPVFLAETGQVERAIAGEINPGPFQAACQQVQAAEVESLVEVRLGDGLAILSPGEVDTVCIAGMGGPLMVRILEEGWEEGKLEGVRRLVLQPNVGEEAVRRWLFDKGWMLSGERILAEDGKCYEVLWADWPGKETEAPFPYSPVWLEGFGILPPEWQFRMGPYLLREASPLFLEKWKRELVKLDRIIGQLAQSSQPEAVRKRKRMQAERNQLKELMACLQRGKPSYS